jgi:thiosulfate/3-mercaptopyruvate sulfurtransferase
MVVVYDDDRNMTAARAWWVLRWAGLPDVRVLDGGLPAWLAAGMPVAHAPGRPAPSVVDLSPGHMPELDADACLALARRGVLLDARIRPNYIGGRPVPGQPARGHIPGALSVPAHDNFTDPGPFTDSETLAELYRGLGADGARPVGVYCGAGMSAAVTVLALAAVGIEAGLYVGSWSAWASDPQRPVATGAGPG